MKVTPIQFIDLLRKSDGYIKYIYTEGGCYQFYLLLTSLFDGCEPLINSKKDHVVTRIDGVLYDINGIAHNGHYHVMTKDDHQKASGWSFYNNNLLKITDCPNCDEPITINCE